MIALQRLGLADAIAAVFADCAVPPAVAREVEAGGELPRWVRRWPYAVRPVASVEARGLDPGESEVITLGIELGDRVVVLDDLDARNLATELGLDTVGTLGLLLAAKRSRVIPLVGPYLNRLPEIRFRAGSGLLRRVLREADELDRL